MKVSHETAEGWLYEDCDLVRVIDGDTIVLRLRAEYPMEVDFGFRIKDHVVHRKEAEIIFRVADLDTPELRGEERPQGLEAKAAAETLLRSGSIKVLSLGEGKYGGRWIGKVYVTQEDGEEIELAGWLIENNYGKPYRVR